MKICQATEWLLFHMWKENPKTSESCPGIIIPETVIYKWGKPYCWYFTGQNGKIHRTTKEKINLENLEKIFTNCSKNPFEEPVTSANNTYNSSSVGKKQEISNFKKNAEISSLKLSVYEKSINPNTNSNGGKNQQNSNKDQQNNNQNSLGQIQYQEIIEFEHILKNQFKSFLHNHNNLQDDEEELNEYQKDNYQLSNEMLLLKFIYPKNNQNQLIKVTWSPNFRLITRRENLNKINNISVPIDKRLCTFEGPEYLMKQDSALSPVIAQDIEQVCQNINSHISDITGTNMQIQKMVLYFKLDYKNRLILQFCTNLKIREVGGYKTRKYRILSPIMKSSLPRMHIEPNTGAQVVGGSVHLQEQKNICSNCEILSTNLVKVNYRDVILSFERNLVDNEETKIHQTSSQKREQQNREKYLLSIKNSKKQKEKNEINLKKQVIIKTKEEEHAENIAFLDHEKQEQECDCSDIPALIQKTWGKMTFQSYQNLRNNISWLKTPVSVCHECFLKFTYYTTHSQLELESQRRRKEFMLEMRDRIQEQQLQEIEEHDQYLRDNVSVQTKNQTPLRKPNLKQQQLLRTQTAAAAGSAFQKKTQSDGQINNNLQYQRSSKKKSFTQRINTQQSQSTNDKNNSSKPTPTLKKNISEKQLKSQKKYSMQTEETISESQKELEQELQDHLKTDKKKYLSENSTDGQPIQQQQQEEIYLSEYFPNQPKKKLPQSQRSQRTLFDASSNIKDANAGRRIKTQSSPRPKFQLLDKKTQKSSVHKSQRNLAQNSQSQSKVKQIYGNLSLLTQGSQSSRQLPSIITARKVFGKKNNHQNDFMTSTASSFYNSSSQNLSFYNPSQANYYKPKNQYDVGMKAIHSIKHCAKSLDINLNDLDNL